MKRKGVKSRGSNHRGQGWEKENIAVKEKFSHSKAFMGLDKGGSGGKVYSSERRLLLARY